ncbi:MAG: hypothetical protein QOJ45_512 [Verrucomicrobiota bacterium]|jgi:hypothetical protein
MKKNAVIPSRDGEGPHNSSSTSLRKENAVESDDVVGRKQTGVAVVRSLAVCAGRDDIIRLSH